MKENDEIEAPDWGPFIPSKNVFALKMKCLLCSHILDNPQSCRCRFFEDKPDDIYYDNAPCPHFERCDDESAIEWIKAYVWEDRGYIPREDDTPPPGWEEINIRQCGPDWRERTAKSDQKEEEHRKIYDHPPLID